MTHNTIGLVTIFQLVQMHSSLSYRHLNPSLKSALANPTIPIESRKEINLNFDFIINKTKFKICNKIEIFHYNYFYVSINEIIFDLYIRDL